MIVQTSTREEQGTARIAAAFVTWTSGWAGHIGNAIGINVTICG